MKLIVVVIVIILVLVEGSTTIRKETIEIINSEVLPGNLLPNFYFSQGKVEASNIVKIGGGRGIPITFVPDDTCGNDVFENINDDLRSPQLPYLTQDLWTCDRKNDSIEVYIMENDHLRVTITPQYGGKISSVFDKKRNREMLYNNKAHQPANIGVLKAWTAGGNKFNFNLFNLFIFTNIIIIRY